MLAETRIGAYPLLVVDRRRNIGSRSRRKISDRFVVIVDDDADNREMYAEYLRFAGCTVVTAVNGTAALARIIARLPDAIVLDLSLPKLDGWAVATMLKADPRTRPIPIVAVSGHTHPGAESEARAAGVDAYLTKPCLPEDVLKTIQQLIEQRRSA